MIGSGAGAGGALDSSGGGGAGGGGGGNQASVASGAAGTTTLSDKSSCTGRDFQTEECRGGNCSSDGKDGEY